jgi:hypothetical protein
MPAGAAAQAPHWMGATLLGDAGAAYAVRPVAAFSRRISPPSNVIRAPRSMFSVFICFIGISFIFTLVMVLSGCAKNCKIFYSFCLCPLGIFGLALLTYECQFSTILVEAYYASLGINPLMKGELL